MNIILTGVTGFVGRHLLFEIIKNQLDRLESLQIVILGRSQKNNSLKNRLLDIFEKEGFAYINTDNKAPIRLFLEQNVYFLEADLRKEDVIDEDNLLKIREIDFTYFFHIAALADLRKTQKVAQDLHEQNVLGTKNILHLVKKLRVQAFNYVGTAYVSGTTTGKIQPDYRNLDQEFRNPYEKSKLEAELLVRNFAKETAIRCRYFRPSIICGRLMERPYGHTHKFDVFYELFSMMFYEKVKQFGSVSDAKQKALEIELRAIYNPTHSINIVPVDYVVKLMYQICEQNLEGDSFYLVNEENTVFGEFLEGALQALKITGVQEVRQTPEKLNNLEMMYYGRAGGLFVSYMTDHPTFFDTSNIRSFAQKNGLVCPKVGKKEAYWLIFYAMKFSFGINERHFRNYLKA